MLRSRRRMLVLSLLVMLACLMPASDSGEAWAQSPEYRAYWVDAWHAGFKSAAECEQLISDVKTSNCNTVFVQMRRRGDTYYPSQIEPWATDANSSFDSLRYLLDRCHAQTPRIEVHAWLVLIPIWTSTTFPTNPDHPSNKYPQYLSKNSSGGILAAFDPGHPGCEQYLTDVVMELVNNYPDLDGISYDYSRFGGTGEGYNDVSVERFNDRYSRAGTPATADALWSQWRRDQITALIRKTYLSAIAQNYNIKMTSAVVTWHPAPGDFASTRPYYEVFQDWDAWMAEGILDLSMPMAYFDEDGSYASDYDAWSSFAVSHSYNRGTLIGPGIYMNDVADGISQIRATRTPSGGKYAKGVVMYSYATTNNDGVANSAFYSALASPSAYDANPTPVFNTPVETPVLPWKANPTVGHIKGTASYNGTAIDGQRENLVVYLTGAASRSLTADGTGFYGFVDLAPGNYTVSATYGSRNLSLPVTVTAGAVAALDLPFTDEPGPTITDVRAESVGSGSAQILWTTSAAASSQVEYGPTTSYGFTTPYSGTMVTGHSVQLTGLASNTTYHYRVRSRTATSQESVSGDYAFTTTSDTTAPVISNLNLVSLTHSTAVVSWNTDEPATTQVQYGLDDTYGQATVEDPALSTSHTATVTGLNGNWTYHFRAKSTNGSGLTGYSDDSSFTTPPAPADVIVDDTEGTYTETAPSYLWEIGTYAGGWPTDNSAYHHVANNRSSTSATFTWTPNLPRAGQYDVYIWFLSGSNRTTDARYTITHADGTTATVHVNQADGTIDSQWYKIGSDLRFNAGTDGYVRLINRTGETAGTKAVIADAVKFVALNVDAGPPTVPSGLQAVALSTSQIQLTWNASTDDTGVAGYKVYRNGVHVGGSAGTSFTDTGLAVNDQYAYTVSAYDAAQQESAPCAAVNRYTLSLPPTDATLTCDRGTNTWYNTPGFTFTNGGFGTGKVNHYGYVWDQSPTHAWTGLELTWVYGSMGLSATSSASPWYFHVCGYNGDNVPNGTLDKGPYYFDSGSPEMDSLTVPWYLRKDPAQSLSANWTGSDAESGVGEYSYAVGTTPGAADICGWTSAGAASSASYSYAAALQSNYFYYFSVKAKDEAGNWSSPLTSHWSVYADAFATIAQAANNPDGTPVIIDGLKNVTGNFGDFLFVQEPDRSRGIRLSHAQPSWVPGSLVEICGILGVAGGERVLTDVAQTSWSAGPVWPGPLAMRIASLGGAQPEPFTPSISGQGSAGCYSLGLLVRVVGRVIEESDGYFVLDDGSTATVRVYSQVNVPDVGMVSATGVASIENGARIIYTRTADDVKSF